ncbi:hybrid sensor histidine kinase/response regulator [Flavobacterium silvaticum]|uniref:histidine kinase n=1 Tax=Flavobacterium silvaticum TaxID=1852020 RepID=A0A972FTD7_9FLAO|nr:hybrid sensor histidine kinase/response regulator [Flavobacterium silvaticum]NMH28148.1 response regulator [Flavobacterium silvaticum]
MRNIIYAIAVVFCFGSVHAQFTLEQKTLPEEISILEYASIANAGNKLLSVQEVENDNITFNKLSGELGNLGFTDENFWLRFSLKNATDSPLLYYLETAEPVTDNVNLYLKSNISNPEIQQSGDNLEFYKRSVANRRTLFEIRLKPGEQKSVLMEIRNDGEKNSLPLKLISQKMMLENTYYDQLIMGVFYGILLVIALTYFFFYFALKESIFLHYSLYVTFMGFCQFALDGFYHEYIGRGNSWLSLHIVILSAILSCYFFGKYSTMALEIRENNPKIYRCFQYLYAFLSVAFVAVILFPDFLNYSYPIINMLTVLGIGLIFVTIGTMFFRRQKVDPFYLSGILILFGCIILAVLMNFGIMPDGFSMDNVTKPGIGLEIIALSLSMANKIRILKTKKEELQAAALQKSEEMNEVKSFFLSNMSHELRTPLNAILGLASAMEQDSNDPKIKADCEVIRYASYGLISSVNDILDFSRIEKGELQLEKGEFRLSDVLAKLARAMKKQHKDKGLKFKFESSIAPEIRVSGDERRLEQLLYNLLGNALKFTNSGKVKFNVSHQIIDGKIRLEFVIKDTGTGIEKEKLESVFELFSQSNFDNKRKFGGFGIGLSIVKALVDLHGGKIDIKSKVGKGTTCRVILDYDVVCEPVKLEHLPTKTIGSRNILIVEDNAMNQMVMKMILKTLPDTTFSIANDGSECLRMMQNEQFNLVLMDLQMPVMDGYEATDAIRKGEAGAKYTTIPIIVITADITPESKERAYALGANDYLTKPVDKKLLIEKIENMDLPKLLSAEEEAEMALEMDESDASEAPIEPVIPKKKRRFKGVEMIRSFFLSYVL